MLGSHLPVPTPAAVGTPSANRVQVGRCSDGPAAPQRIGVDAKRPPRHAVLCSAQCCQSRKSPSSCLAGSVANVQHCQPGVRHTLGHAWLHLGSKHVVGLSWVRSTQLASQSCTILYYIEHRLSSYVVSAPSSCCTCTAQCMCMPVLLHECCTIMARASGYPAVGWQRVISCVAFTAPLRGKTYILQCVASTIGVVMLVLACTPTVPGEKQRLGWVRVCLCLPSGHITAYPWTAVQSCSQYHLDGSDEDWRMPPS